MSNEIQCSTSTGSTIYALVRNVAGQIWNGSAFANYSSAAYATYPIALVEQGSSGYYTGNFPATAPAGTFNVVAKRQAGGSAAESDATVAAGSIEWNGGGVAPLSDTATSGQVGQVAPIRIARGTQILNFPFYLVSSVDHVTPFTSGIVSGQIARDNGAFGALQSGAFQEKGLGFFTLNALTSGDLLANTVSLLFTAVGVSGGQSDPRAFSMVLQRVSGQ